MKRILVGTDGSETATGGVRWAAVLADALDAEVVVATVLAPDSGGDRAPETDQRNDVPRRLDEEWTAPAHELGSRLRTLVLQGDPRTALLEAATTEGADLLVLGSAGTGWFPALHLGHVAHAIAHHTTVPVVIVPGDHAMPVSGSIVVGIDGSPGSTVAVRWVADVARALGSEVIAVHGHLRKGASEPSSELDAQSATWAAPLQAAGVPTRVVIQDGWPAKVITDLQASEHPALIAVGSRGAGGFHDLRLGSVALQVLQHARVPVAIVPQAS